MERTGPDEMSGLFSFYGLSINRIRNFFPELVIKGKSVFLL